MRNLRVLSILWFAALLSVVGYAHAQQQIVKRSAGDLLNSGSLVIAALMLLIGILLVAVIVLYRDNKANSKERQDLALKNLQVLSDLQKTIEANTQARINVGS